MRIALRPKLTQAEGFILGVGAKMFSCCGARHLPCRRSGFVICRPLPLAQVASSATGGAPIAPHRGAGDRVWCFCQCSIRLDLLDNDPVLTAGTPVLRCSGRICVCGHRKSGVPTRKGLTQSVKPFENVTDFLLEDPHF